MASNAEMVDYIWPISTNYVFGGSRYEPYNTDCSGMVCAAFWHVHGIDPSFLGDWTGAQWNRGLLKQLWWGQTPYLPWDIMQKGDVIFTSTSAPSSTASCAKATLQEFASACCKVWVKWVPLQLTVSAPI